LGQGLLRDAGDGRRLVDEAQCEVFAKPASSPWLAVAPDPALRGVEQWCTRRREEVPNRPSTFVARDTGLEHAVLGQDVEGERVVDEDIGECETSAVISVGVDLGIAHFLAHEILIGVREIDSDVAGAYVGTPTSVVRGVHAHRGVDAPRVGLALWLKVQLNGLHVTKPHV
jgi:hypothetical protein